MTRLFRILPATLACTGILAVALPACGWAQSAREQEQQAAAEEAQEKAKEAKEAKRAAPPAAIPGASQDDDDNEHSNSDMEPTAALFDAINRGSIGAAKESINRGADLNTRNILGQTPLDMSIDMNRNPITFLLLSLRNTDYNAANTRGRVTTGTATVKMENGSGHLTIGGDSSKARVRRSANGGTPNPSIGFLGFSGN